ncbi:hypothetical protein [Pseudofulvimonas gallinarii]|uniref:Tetratricopeptide repeat protein n=2 Tax=Pseudofulvimonas gallinarii TaxID=634155 RepID=A0A4R3LPF2_9GAMM|nr:hypothetical protein EDC25_103183 [Pseudofulvimonas gallinarii]
MNITHRRFLLLATIVALLGAGVFSLGLGGPFVLDDAHTIVENAGVHMESLDRDSLLDAAASFYAGKGTRPLPMLTFGLDYWRHGSLDARTYKMTNLFIHALTTLLLALFVRRLLRLADWPAQRAALAALAVALVWAVHPLQVSSVLYVVQRMQTMAALFLVLALWAYLGLRRAEMEDRPGWRYGVLALVSWVLALASKEDAILLPVYALVLELTVLRFRVSRPERERGLRRSWLAAALVGVAVFLFWALPHYWSSEAYPGRDFNSMERLLTQARVLVMHLGQVLLPLPSLMPFNYDDFEVSRGLLQPVTTLLALLALTAVLVWAWLWRRRRPVFACGVLFFFAGHVLTSNVIALELVFEHRNHLPLVGAVLALVDLFWLACQRWQAPQRWSAVGAGALLLLVTVAGGARAHLWGDAARFAEHNVDIAPDSPRACLTLGGVYFDLAGRKNSRGSPYLDRAIEAVEDCAQRTGSASAYSNIVIYKTIQGTVTPEDWQRLLQRLEEVPMLPANKNILWTTFANVRAEIGLEEAQVMRVLDVIVRRAQLQPAEYLRIGAFLYLSTSQPDAALPYFVRGAEMLPTGDRSVVNLRNEFRAVGRDDWARALEKANRMDSTPGSRGL